MKKGKLATINIFIGFFSQFIILALGLIIPKIIINNYGSDTNGLTNTITQIFTYIALLEAGIGKATENALYPVLKNNDKNDISQVMSVSRRYYRKISLFYAIAVLAVASILPFVLKTSVNYTTIFFYVFFEGLTSLVQFYFTGLWSIFLNASGKTYFTNLVNLGSKILQYTVKIILALLGLNIMYVQIGYFAVSLFGLLIYSIYMHKNYSWIDYKCAPKDKKLPDRNAYVLNEIASAIFSGTDLIVLSIMVSTSLSSVYSIYSMVFGAVTTLINSIYNSINYLLGHSYARDIETYKKIHDAFNSIFLGVLVACMSVCMWLTIPFVKLYTKGVTDINYIYEWLPFCFAVVQILSWSRYIGGNLTGIAGYAKPVSFISLAEAIINIVGTVVLTYFFGIYGAIIATIVAIPIKVIYVNYLAEKKILKRSPLKTIMIFIVNYSLFAITVVISSFIKIEINSYTWFVAWGLVLTIGYLIVCLGMNLLVNKDLLIIFKTIKNRKLNKSK